MSEEPKRKRGRPRKIHPGGQVPAPKRPKERPSSGDKMSDKIDAARAARDIIAAEKRQATIDSLKSCKDQNVMAYKRDAFLKAVSEGATIKRACSIAMLERSTVHRWRADKDDDFEKLFQEAREDGGETLEEELYTRALAGSDLCLIVGLKAFKPEKYRDNYRAPEELKVTHIVSFQERFGAFEESLKRARKIQLEQQMKLAAESGEMIDITPKRIT